MQSFLEKIRQSSETHKQGVALGLSLVLTLVVAFGWAGQRGLIEFSGDNLAQKASVAPSARAENPVSGDLPTPLDQLKLSLGSAWSGLGEVYGSVRDSLAGVFVPFITGIEVYERR